MLVCASCLHEWTGLEAVWGCAGVQVCTVPLKSHSCLSVLCVCSLSLCVVCLYLHSPVSVPGLSACALLPALAGGDICPSPQQ